MKKLAILFIALFAIVLKGFSQSANSGQSFGKKLLGKMEFGITAGVNASNFTSANFPTDPLPGFQAGLTVAYKFTDNFMVHEEFLYAMQGAKIKGGLLGTQDIKLSYASVPILLKYRNNSGFFVEAGPQAGFKIKEDIGGITDTKFLRKLILA